MPVERGKRICRDKDGRWLCVGDRVKSHRSMLGSVLDGWWLDRGMAVRYDNDSTWSVHPVENGVAPALTRVQTATAFAPTQPVKSEQI